MNHDRLGNVTKFVKRQLPKALRTQLDGYRQMLGVANTLMDAVQRTVNPACPSVARRPAAAGPPTASGDHSGVGRRLSPPPAAPGRGWAVPERIPGLPPRTIRGGAESEDRQLNHALHVIVTWRMVHRHPPTQAYLTRRRAQQLSDAEVRRCLKRYTARRLFRLTEASVAT